MQLNICMITPFQEFDVDNFDLIQNKLVPYIVEKYHNNRDFWNHLDCDQLNQQVPELFTAVKQITGQMPLRAYVLIIPDAPPEKLKQHLNGNSLHRDTSDESTRLNWPVFNSDSIETKFFSSSAEPKKLLLPTGETYLTYHEQDCEEIAGVQLTRPTAIHVHTIHGLYLKKPQLPRHILSFTFEQDIEHLLKN